MSRTLTVLVASAALAALTLAIAGVAWAQSTHLVINEVDYDQPDLDTGEFLEVYNPKAAAVDLTGLAVVFINGAGNLEYRRVNLTGAGTGSLPAGGYLVLASNSVAVDPAATVVRFSFAADNIQNGGPDGVALFDTSTNTLVDALSYEGAISAASITGAPGTYNLVEGNLFDSTAQDSNVNADSLIRFPSGVDTDNAAYDWRFATSVEGVPTPGASNGGEFLDCGADLLDNDGDAMTDEPGERCTPETTIDPASVPASHTNSTSAGFTFSSSKDNASFSCSLTTPSSPGGASEDCSSGSSSGMKDYTDLTEDDYTFEVVATDAFGNTDPTPASYTWTVDTTVPTVTDAAPIGTEVSRNTNLTATFSEQMNPATLTKSTFKLSMFNPDGTTTRITPTKVTASPDGLSATLDPFKASSTQLEATTKYRAIVTVGAADLAGNQLDQKPLREGSQSKSWTFTTGS